MAGIVENRARMWELVQEVTEQPTNLIVERLASGEWVEDVQEAVQWLGDAAERFRPGLLAAEEAVSAPPVTLAALATGYDVIHSRERT